MGAGEEVRSFTAVDPVSRVVQVDGVKVFVLPPWSPCRWGLRDGTIVTTTCTGWGLTPRGYLDY